RCASITGGFVALALALARLEQQRLIDRLPLTDSVAAVSVGVVDGRILLDLPYEEDHRAAVDMNLVMTGAGRVVEVQGTAEGGPAHRPPAGRAGVRRRGGAGASGPPAATDAARGGRAAPGREVTPNRLVLASANPGKIAELAVLVREWGDVVTQDLSGGGVAL